MAKKKRKQRPESADSLRLDPETRLAPRFDSVSVARFPIAAPQEMGFRVLDDCTEEHIQ